MGDQLDIAAQLQPLQLDDVLPGATGIVRGQLQVSGKRDAPDITADIAGNGLRWDTYSAQSISLRGRLPWRGSDGQLALQGTAIEAGVVLDSVRVQARGAVEALRLDADIANSMASVALQGDVRRNGERWQGQVATLRIAPAKGDAWALRKPAQFSTDGAAFTFSDTCLGAATGGALCASANWPREGMVVHGDALPLSLVQPWLPKQEGRQIYLRGELSLDGSFAARQRLGRQPAHRLARRRHSLGRNPLRGSGRQSQSRRVAALRPIQRAGRFHPATDPGQARYRFPGRRLCRCQVQYRLGCVRAAQRRAVSEHVAAVLAGAGDCRRGAAEGAGRGPREPARHPRQTAARRRCHLERFHCRIPVDGFDAERGQGPLRCAAGRLGQDHRLGQVRPRHAHRRWWVVVVRNQHPVAAQYRGDNVLAYNTSELRIIANPDMQFGITDNTMQLRGKVTVPEADIDLERLDRGTSVSEDVVVLDPVDPEQTPASPLDMDLAIVLGDKVNMSGFGLKGGLSGQMQIRARPGREMTANGGLDVRGRYKAYGRDLTITRGQLTWNNNIVSDPRVSLRAERKIGDVTAGIDVSGRAESPRADVWSEPAMSQSEALSYLVTRRGLSTASSDETQQVSAASAALSAGSSLIASQIGAKLGLDEAGVSQSSTLGSVVGFGKYLSPKLYVGYGVSMVGGGSVLTLKYLLSRGFDIEAESSTIETKGR